MFITSRELNALIGKGRKRVERVLKAWGYDYQDWCDDGQLLEAYFIAAGVCADTVKVEFSPKGRARSAWRQPAKTRL